MESSNCYPLFGARIEEIKQRVLRDKSKISLLIFKNGVDGFIDIGKIKTVDVIECMIKANEKKNMRIAVVEIIRRPREGLHEDIKKKMNK